MALMPARVKYRKMQRGSRTGIASRGNTVAFGEYGLQSLERCWMDTKQIEAARVAIAHSGMAIEVIERLDQQVVEVERVAIVHLLLEETLDLLDAAFVRALGLHDFEEQ